MITTKSNPHENWPTTAQLKARGVPSPKHLAKRGIPLLGIKTIHKHTDPTNSNIVYYEPVPFKKWLSKPRAECVQVKFGDMKRGVTVAVVTIGKTECYTHAAARKLLRCSNSQLESHVEDRDIKVLKDRIYRDTGGKLNEADVYPRQSVDSFKPQLTQRRKSKAAKTRNREQRRERRQQEPKLVDGCWTDPQGRPWEADFASEHSPDLLDRRVPKGHRQKKFFHIAGQRSRFVWVTLQSESKALTAERYPDRNKQAEQPKEIDDAPLPLQILADLKDVHLGTLRKLTNKQNRLTKKPNRHPAFDNKPMPSVKESYNWFRNDGTVRMTRTVVKATPRNVDIYLDWYARKHPSTIEFVGRALSTGTKWRADVIADAKKAGFAAVTVDRAYRQLGGHSERSNSAARSAAGKFMKGSARRCARWSLPEPVAAKYREKLAAASNGRQAPLVNPPDDEPKSPAAETATAAVVESKPIEPPGKSTLGSNDRALRLAAQRVADCIKNLPGQGSKEIAKQAKIPAGTVRQIILRELTPLGYFTQGKAYFPPRKS